MNTNCPLFKIGTCKGYITRECNYKYHKKCKDNFLCSDENCNLGHGISYIKRNILININNKYSQIDNFNISSDKCIYPLVCTKSECKLHHLLEYNHRQNIIYIINTNLSDKEALNYYNKKYETPIAPITPIAHITPITPIKCYSPVSSTKSYADLVKSNISNISNIIEDTMEDTMDVTMDVTMDIMDDIIEENKNIKMNTNKIESIKKQIIELENSLKDYENNIKISNDKLRNLANKIADI